MSKIITLNLYLLAHTAFGHNSILTNFKTHANTCKCKNSRVVLKDKSILFWQQKRLGSVAKIE